MAIRRKARTASTGTKTTSEAPRKRRGVSEEGGMASTADLGGGYINKFKIEAAKNKHLIMFPVVTADGEPKVKTIEHFACNFGSKLSDGKWHSFQLPESDEVYEACLNNSQLEKVKTRFALILVYDTDTHGKTKGIENISYYYAWLKVSDFVKNSVVELLEDSEGSLTGQDITVKLTAKDNSLKMQEMLYVLPRTSGGFAKKGKCTLDWRAIQKEAAEIWANLEDRVVRQYKDDEILALVDNYDTDEEDDAPVRKSASRRGSAGTTTKKKKFSRKDFEG